MTEHGQGPRPPEKPPTERPVDEKETMPAEQSLWAFKIPTDLFADINITPPAPAKGTNERKERRTAIKAKQAGTRTPRKKRSPLPTFAEQVASEASEARKRKERLLTSGYKYAAKERQADRDDAERAKQNLERSLASTSDPALGSQYDVMVAHAHNLQKQIAELKKATSGESTDTTPDMDELREKLNILEEELASQDTIDRELTPPRELTRAYSLITKSVKERFDITQDEEGDVLTPLTSVSSATRKLDTFFERIPKLLADIATLKKTLEHDILSLKSIVEKREERLRPNPAVVTEQRKIHTYLGTQRAENPGPIVMDTLTYASGDHEPFPGYYDSLLENPKSPERMYMQYMDILQKIKGYETALNTPVSPEEKQKQWKKEVDAFLQSARTLFESTSGEQPPARSLEILDDTLSYRWKESPLGSLTVDSIESTPTQLHTMRTQVRDVSSNFTKQMFGEKPFDVISDKSQAQGLLTLAKSLREQMRKQFSAKSMTEEQMRHAIDIAGRGIYSAIVSYCGNKKVDTKKTFASPAGQTFRQELFAIATDATAPGNEEDISTQELRYATELVSQMTPRVRAYVEQATPHTFTDIKEVAGTGARLLSEAPPKTETAEIKKALASVDTLLTTHAEMLQVLVDAGLLKCTYTKGGNPRYTPAEKKETKTKEERKAERNAKYANTAKGGKKGSDRSWSF